MTIVRRARPEIDLDKVDWLKLVQITDEEIDDQITSDPDTAPIFTDWELAHAARVLPRKVDSAGSA